MGRVEIRSVSKLFGEVRAVDHVDLATDEGEFLVLLGPSGCGKTTLLRMIAGIETPTSGDLVIDGRVVTDMPPRMRNIAMVFQSYALYPHMTVYKNIAFPLRARGIDEGTVRKKVEWAAGMFKIGRLLDRKPRELSGGERQRVALARAMVREPSVFLLDEPLSNLDALLRTSAREELRQFQRRVGVTTIYVTHDQVEAMTMGDRVAVMTMGVLQQVDRPQHLYDEPANLFVAGFIGTPPMNLFEGTVHVAGDDVTVTIGRVTLPVAPICVQRYAAVRRLDGKDVVVGVRAEDLHPTSARPDYPTVEGSVELVEALGSGLMAYFRIDAESVRPSAVEAVEEAEGAEGIVAARPNLIAHFPPRLDLRLGETVPIAVDTAGLHFFERETGAALR